MQFKEREGSGRITNSRKNIFRIRNACKLQSQSAQKGAEKWLFLVFMSNEARNRAGVRTDCEGDTARCKVPRSRKRGGRVRDFALWPALPSTLVGESSTSATTVVRDFYGSSSSERAPRSSSVPGLNLSNLWQRPTRYTVEEMGESRGRGDDTASAAKPPVIL